jgi:hypothetical protein
MFAWLIRRCNASLDARELTRELCIGVLDIAGFEIFDVKFSCLEHRDNYSKTMKLARDENSNLVYK